MARYSFHCNSHTSSRAFSNNLYFYCFGGLRATTCFVRNVLGSSAANNWSVRLRGAETPAYDLAGACLESSAVVRNKLSCVRPPTCSHMHKLCSGRRSNLLVPVDASFIRTGGALFTRKSHTVANMFNTEVIQGCLHHM